MNLHEIAYYFSDGFLNLLLITLVTDYKVFTSVLLGPLAIWLLRKYTAFTPWTSDDDLPDKLEDLMENKRKDA